MSKKSKTKKGFFEAIKNIKDKRIKEQILIELQSHAYRSIINDDMKSLPIRILIPNDGNLYSIFRNNYNQFVGTPVPESSKVFVSNVVSCRSKSIKKKKKNATRIKKEMLRMCKNGWFGVNDETTKKCICDFESAIRESYIIIRRTLKAKAYNTLPKQLQITGGTFILSSQYYIKSDLSDQVYLQNKKIRLSNKDMRFVQYQIADSVFDIVRRI